MNIELPIYDMFKFVKNLSEKLKNNGKEDAEKLLEEFLIKKCQDSSINIDEIRSTDTLQKQSNTHLLLKKECRLLQKKEWTLLHCAAFNDDMETCKFLIEKGANIFALNNNRQDTLSVASKMGSADVVDFLIEKINPNNLSPEEKTARIDSLSRSLPSDKVYTITPLLHACGTTLSSSKFNVEKRLRVIQALLDAGADPKAAEIRTWDDENEKCLTTVLKLIKYPAEIEISEEMKGYVVNALKAIISKIEESEVVTFLNDITVKERVSIIGIVKRFNALDFCEYQKDKSKQPDTVRYWDSIQAFLSDQGAEFSKLIPLDECISQTIQQEITKNGRNSSFDYVLKLFSISGPFCFISDMVLLVIKKPDFESNKNMYFAMCSSVMVLMVIGICCYFNDKYYDKNATQITDARTEAVSSPTKTSR